MATALIDVPSKTPQSSSIPLPIEGTDSEDTIKKHLGVFATMVEKTPIHHPLMHKLHDFLHIISHLCVKIQSLFRYPLIACPISGSGVFIIFANAKTNRTDTT